MRRATRSCTCCGRARGAPTCYRSDSDKPPSDLGTTAVLLTLSQDVEYITSKLVSVYKEAAYSAGYLNQCFIQIVKYHPTPITPIQVDARSAGMDEAWMGR